MISSLDDLSETQKSDMVAALSVFLAASGTPAEDEDLITPAKVQAIASASGNSMSESLATLYASVAAKAPGGVLEAYMPSPGGGGGGGYVRTFLSSFGGSRLCVCFLTRPLPVFSSLFFGYSGGGGGGGGGAEEAKEEEPEEEEEAEVGGAAAGLFGDEGDGDY